MIDQIAINFKLFHAENPRVYRLFCLYASQMVVRGFDYGSAKLIFERIRWEISMTTTAVAGNALLKINNNYTSRYSRMWMIDNPDHDGFFRTRKLSMPTIDSTEFDEEPTQEGFDLGT